MGAARAAAAAAILAGSTGFASAATWAELAPLFAEHCTVCHSGDSAPLGLRLDSLEGVLAGSENGPVVVAGDPEASELVRRLRGTSEPRMPLTGPPWLDEADIARIERWIAEGMPAGAETADTAEAGTVPARPAPPGPGEPVLFSHVEPILLARCVKCHRRADGYQPPEGLVLATYADVLAGGERVVVVPGRPLHSELIRRVRGLSQPRMPFDGPPWLDEEEIALLGRWIADGARDAEGRPAPVPAGREVRYRGILTQRWAVDGAEVVVDGATRMRKLPAVGEPAEIRGVVLPDGRVRATRIRRR